MLQAALWYYKFTSQLVEAPVSKASLLSRLAEISRISLKENNSKESCLIQIRVIWQLFDSLFTKFIHNKSISPCPQLQKGGHNSNLTFSTKMSTKCNLQSSKWTYLNNFFGGKLLLELMLKELLYFWIFIIVHQHHSIQTKPHYHPKMSHNIKNNTQPILQGFGKMLFFYYTTYTRQ